MTKSSLDELLRKYRGLFPGRTGIDLVYTGDKKLLLLQKNEKFKNRTFFFLRTDPFQVPVLLTS